MMIKVVDILKNETLNDFEDSDFILITGITESTLDDAITLAESARESGIITAGIPAGNYDVKRFADIADAVIFTRNEEDISQGIAEDISEIADNSARILAGIFRNVGTVHYGSGVGDDVESAIRKAAEMCGDIHGSKMAHVIMSVPLAEYDHEAFWEIEENILEEICGHGVKSVTRWDSNEDGKFTAKIFALMYDAGYTSWCELFANESAENITAMIENGLDGRTKRLGTEKSFFAACLRFGTPELVRQFISKGHNPKELETDGYTPLMMIDFSKDTDNAHEILKLLLANGADINASADNGMTPFTNAARWIYARPDIVRTFLDAGANVNTDFTDDCGIKPVLDIMFNSADSFFSESEEVRTFLREVLPMMINAGAKINPSESRTLREVFDDEYQDFRRNWKSLLTDPANKSHALRLFCDAIAEYDTETLRGIIERISPEKIVPDYGESLSEFLRVSAGLAFRINDFPESVSKPSAQNTEIKRRLDKGAEILRILKEAGIIWPLVLPEGAELTYVINESWSHRRNIEGMNPLCLCHSPEALKKVIASGNYDTNSALAEIALRCDSYYQPGEMMNVLLNNGADIHSLRDTQFGEFLSHRGERIMLDNFQQAKFIAEFLWKHDPADITNVRSIQHYDGWEEYYGGPLSCHMLSHLWEMIESGTDNGGTWVRFWDMIMLLSACWGTVNDIEDSINHGGNVNYKTWLGYSPLMYAVFFNDSEAVKFLIKNGADINTRNIHNQNAAMLAVTSDYHEWDSNVIGVLAEFGADIHDGLMSLAVDAGNVKAVKALLSLGVKLTDKNAVNDSEPVTGNEKPCPKCGRILERRTSYCPSCGYVLPVSERYGLNA